MCMITVNVNDKRKKSLFSEDEIKFILDANKQNPDGFGYYAWNKRNGKCEIEKFYPKTDQEKVENVLRTFNEKRKDYSFVITHSRWGTSGGKGLSQVHPIPVISPDKNGRNRYEGWFIIHNGVLENQGELISDTQLYGYELGQWLYERNIKTIDNIIESEEFVGFLSNGMFKNNRVVLVKNDRYIIFNRDTGKEVNKFGDWHSGELTKYYMRPTKFSPWSNYESYYSDWAMIHAEKYDLSMDEEVMEIIDEGKPTECAVIYNYATGATIQRAPSKKIEANELDFDPTKKINK